MFQQLRTYTLIHTYTCIGTYYVLCQRGKKENMINQRKSLRGREAKTRILASNRKGSRPVLIPVAAEGLAVLAC